MTTRPLLTLWLLVLALSGAALALTAPAASRSHGRLQGELARLAAARAQAAEIALLRGDAPEWTRRPPPGSGLAERVSGALAAAGLPASALASLSPAAEADAGGGSGLRARKRRAVVTLSGVTLPQVGGFLAAWRRLEPAWTVAGVDLIQDHAHRAPPGGGDLPLRASIALEALYVDEHSSGASRR